MLNSDSISNRFLIALRLSEPIEKLVRGDYQRVFRQPLPVKTLHCTLIPPFTFKSPTNLTTLLTQLKIIPNLTDTFTFGSPGIFNFKSRQVLYLPIQPASPLLQLFHQLMDITKSTINIETADFKHHRLPEFLPHLTLNYNFTDSLTAFTPPTNYFNLASPQLLIQTGSGIWQPYST